MAQAFDLREDSNFLFIPCMDLWLKSQVQVRGQPSIGAQFTVTKRSNGLLESEVLEGGKDQRHTYLIIEIKFWEGAISLTSS